MQLNQIFWIHCNSCFRYPTEKEEVWYILNCHHIFCQPCFSKKIIATDQECECSKCEVMVNFAIYSNTINYDLTKDPFLNPSSELLASYIEIYQYQINNSNSLIKFLKEKTVYQRKVLLKARDHLVMNKKLKEKITSLELENKALKETILKQERRSPNQEINTKISENISSKISKQNISNSFSEQNCLQNKLENIQKLRSPVNLTNSSNFNRDQLFKSHNISSFNPANISPQNTFHRFPNNIQSLKNSQHNQTNHLSRFDPMTIKQNYFNPTPSTKGYTAIAEPKEYIHDLNQEATNNSYNNMPYYANSELNSINNSEIDKILYTANPFEDNNTKPISPGIGFTRKMDEDNLLNESRSFAPSQLESRRTSRPRNSLKNTLIKPTNKALATRVSLRARMKRDSSYFAK